MIVQCSMTTSHSSVQQIALLVTTLLLEDFVRDENLYAFARSTAPISDEHGGPVRLIVPHLYAWKSAKWIKGINFIENEELGFWENLGYHSYGDPWKELRFKF